MKASDDEVPLSGYRVACVMGRTPWPVDDGWRMRSLQLSKAWAAMGAELHLFALCQPHDHPQDSPPAHFESVTIVPRGKAYRASDIALGVIGRTPLPVRNYAEPAMAQALRSRDHERPFDLVVIEDIVMAQYAPCFEKARVVLDMHNVESHLFVRYARSERNPLRKIYASMTGRALRRYEQQVTKGFAGVLVCSDDDRVRLEQLGYAGPAEVVPNGIDLERFEQPLSPPQSEDLVFVGSMDYHANISGVLYFCRDVLPILRQSRPNIRLRIVGKNPSAEIRELSSGAIEVTGRVEDVRPFFAASAVSIVPLLVGGGTRLKILESMAFGRPVVSTALGAEGLDFLGADVIRIADGPERFAQAISSLLDSPKEAALLGDRGRRFVFDHYGWERIGSGARPFMQRMVGARPRSITAHVDVPDSR